MIVYFIRHGQSEGNRRRMNCGWNDTPLSELGHQQAKAAHAYLKDVPFDKIFCSDLPRAMQTCQDALPGCEMILTPKIREVGVGDLAGHYIADNAARYPDYWDSVKKQDFSAYGGETQAQMKERVQDFIRDLEKLEGECRYVAVFGHEGTVHQMLNYCFGYDILLEHTCIQNASATVFELRDGVWRLRAFSYVGELNV